MAAKKEPPAPVVPATNGETKKFTINVQSTGQVSATIRTDDKAEALALLEELKPIVNPPRKKRKSLFPGDPCDCGGSFVIRQNRSGGQFLGCSEFPECEATALIDKEYQPPQPNQEKGDLDKVPF